jgi:AcrR family transcriptional regulator
VDDGPSGTTPMTWRELAVARSLDPARARAESRVQRYLDAALDLLNSDGGKEFTVQEVVERSGQSLRGFYQYFAGKHELLLALFEESVHETAEHLRGVVAGADDPLDRLRCFVAEYHRLCRSEGRGAAPRAPAPAIAEFAHQLLTRHPKEAAEAFMPLVSLLVDLLDDAEAAGVIRAALSHRRIAGVVLQAIMFNSFATTIIGSSSRPDDGDAAALWDLLLLGLGTGSAA